jgi:hypothetical protein
VRHYVLTRSVYGPEWTPEENARRLALTRAVTVPLMAAQDNRNWTWIVALHPDDPLLTERRAAFQSAAPAYRELLWSPGERSTPQDVASRAYRSVPWSDAIGPRDDVLLQTRLDDDDGLVPDAIKRFQHDTRLSVLPAAILMLPRGIRVWDGRYSMVRHTSNAMHTLMTAPGNRLGVYDYGHTRCRRAAPVKMLGDRLGWLWVRHRDTISGWHEAHKPLCDGVRAAFPIDWQALEAAWVQ